MLSVPQRTTRAAATLTWGLLAFLILNGFVLSGVLRWVSPEPYNDTVLQHTWKLLTGHSGDDSWGAIDVALEKALDEPGVPLYSTVFFTEQYRFQYPPSAMFALSALRAVAPPDRIQINDEYEGPWPSINAVFAWIFIALNAMAVVLLLEVGLRRAQPDVDWRHLLPARAVIVVGLVLTFYPVVKAFTLGQIQVWINALVALGLLAWVMGWRGSSGILIGLTALMKPHYGLILVWAGLRREWRFVGLCLGVIAGGTLAAVYMFGLGNHLDYLKVLSFLSQRGETYFPNQSVNGLLNRVMSIGAPNEFVALDLPAGKFPPFTPWIYGLTLLSSIALIAAALWYRRGATPGGVDFAIIALSCTMASPIAWEHHYGITLPIYAVLLAANLGDRRRLMWIGASYVLVSTFLPVTNLLAGSALNILQSLLFAGAIMLLVLLYRQAETTSGAGAGHPRREALVETSKEPAFST